MTTPLSHLYLTAHGEWTVASWIGEKAQIGIRCFVTGVAATPPFGQRFTMPANGVDTLSVEPHTAVVNGTNGVLAQTFRVDGTGIPPTVIGDPELIDYAEDFRTYLNGLKAYFQTGFRWTHFKVAPIKPDGSYAQPATVYTLNTPIVGTGVTAQLPPEVACAVSLRAPVMGRRGRGRMYLPALGGGALASDGVLGTGFKTDLGTLTAAFVQGLQNMPGADWPVDTWVIVTSAGSPEAVRPTQVRVGNHFDVQARRQDQVPEVYTSTAL